jgi:hypothetical protein
VDYPALFRSVEIAVLILSPLTATVTVVGVRIVQSMRLIVIAAGIKIGFPSAKTSKYKLRVPPKLVRVPLTLVSICAFIQSAVKPPPTSGQFDWVIPGDEVDFNL